VALWTGEKDFRFFDDKEKGVISCIACGTLIKFIFAFDFA
jgi:hypothetical protein